MTLPKEKSFSITQVSDLLDVSPDTLRRWEKRGKIKPQRSSGGKRLYSREDITFLRYILGKPENIKAYGTKEASHFLGVSSDTIRRWEKKGAVLPQRTVGGQRIFTLQEIVSLKEDAPKLAKIKIPVNEPIKIIGNPIFYPRYRSYLNSRLISFVIISALLIGYAKEPNLTLQKVDKVTASFVNLPSFISKSKNSETKIINSWTIGKLFEQKKIASNTEVIKPTPREEVLQAATENQDESSQENSSSETPVLPNNDQTPSDLNLLFDSSFEASVLNYEPKGWAYILSSSLSNTRVSSESIRTGALSLKFEDSTASQAKSLPLGISQATTTTINGRNYVFSVNIRSKNIVGNPTLRIGFIGVASNKDPNYGTAYFTKYAEDKFIDYTLSASNNKDWETYSFEYDNAALGKYPFVQISGYVGGKIFLEDLTMYEVLKGPILSSIPQENDLNALYNKIIYQRTYKIGDGSITIDPDGSMYPTQGLGFSGSLGKSDKRFGALYVSDLNISILRINNQLQLGQFTSNPTNEGLGSLYFNSADDNVYVWNGTSWTSLGGQTLWQRNASGALAPAQITDDLLLGATSTASALIKFTGTAGNNSWINTGNVGIGTTTPSQLLEVLGNIYANSGQVRIGNFGSAPVTTGEGSLYYDTVAKQIYYYNGTAWTAVGSGSGTSWWTEDSGALYPINTTLDLLVGGTATSSAFVKLTGSSGGSSFINTGNVGIGTTSPGTNLSIVGGVGIGTTDSFAGSAIAANNLAIQGSVGIGTTSPTQSLDINGNMHLSGALYDVNNDVGGSGQVLSSTVAGVDWIDAASLGTNYWQITSGSLAPYNETLALNIGSTASSSAYFHAPGSNNDNAWFNLGTGKVGIGTTQPNYELDVIGVLGTYDLITHDITIASSSANIISAYKGFDGYTNFSGGIGTGGIGKDSITNAQRITSQGNLVNIGSIQAGETLLTNAGTFADLVNKDTGASPQSVAIGDLNGDGYTDMAVANYGDDTVSILMNNGDGTFADQVTKATGANPYSVAIGDLNGDGKADLAVTNSGSTTVSIYINNGDGTFANQVTYTTGSGPRSVAIGDLNGDGKADLAIANYGPDTVGILINNGDGTFADQVTKASGLNPFSVAIGDFSGDGKADLAVANRGATTVSTYINNGDGTFADQVTKTAGTSPASVAFGDLNGDGKNDMAVANNGSDTISTYINNGDGTFADQVTKDTGASPESVAIGDLNGDGYADMAVANYSSLYVSIFINDGNGTFADQVTKDSGANSDSVAIGDLNGDGKSDMAVASGGGSTVDVFINTVSPMLYAQASTGRVGIGTTGPGTKLDVVGDVKFNGNFSLVGGAANFSNSGDNLNLYKNIGPNVTDSWSTGTTGGTARDAHTSVLYNGKMYSWAGWDGGGMEGEALNTVDIYDIASDSWSTGTAGGNARYDHTSVLYNGKMYSWAGIVGETWANTVDIYDIASDSWSTGTAGGTARGNHSSVLYNGKIYSWAGVTTGLNLINTVDIYDIASDSWSTGTAGGTARFGQASIIHNGKIYAWGGMVVDPINTMDIYDIATDTWTTGATGGTARVCPVVAVYNNKIYYWSGMISGGNINTVDIYDIATNTWSTGTAGGPEVTLATSVLYNGKIYAWGGNTTGGDINTVEIYDIGYRQNILTFYENGESMLSFRTNATLNLDYGRLGITGGNLGIGTTVPGTKLSIVGGVGIGTTDSFASKAIAANNLAVQGSVGIGVTSPATPLEIMQSGSGVLSSLSLTNSLREDGTGTQLLFSGYSLGVPNSLRRNVAAITGIMQDSGGSTYEGVLTFSTLDHTTGTTEKMRINNIGYVGIGTTSPGTNLSIVGGVGIGTTDSFANAAIAASNLAVQGSVGIGTTSPGSLLQVSGAPALNYIGQLDVYATSTNDSIISARRATEASDSTLYLGYGDAGWYMSDRGHHELVFNDSATGDVMTLYNSSVGIGTTNPGVALDVVGNARFSAVGIGTSANDLRITSDGTLTTVGSDIRLKTNLNPLSNILSKILALKPYFFNWRDPSDLTKPVDPSQPKDVGLIAQDVQTIFPEITFTNPVDGMMGINYSKLPAILVSAIQEQQYQISSISAQLTGLSLTASGELNKEVQATQAAEQTTSEVLSIATESATLDKLNSSLSELSSKVASQEAKMVNFETDLLLLKSQAINSEVSSNATSSASFTSLNVSGNSVLGDVVISGRLSIGTLILDSLNASLDSIGPLKIQSQGLATIEFQADSIEMDKNGNLIIKNGVIVGNEKIRGTVDLAADQTSVRVDKVWETAPVSINVTPSYKTSTWVVDISEKGFTINVSDPPSDAQKLYWWAIW